MPIRLLAVDLDGTLLTKERVPHPQNIIAVQKAMAAGIKVVPASGRVAASVLQFSHALGFDEAMICSNGAHVQGQGGIELLHVELSPEAVQITLDYAETASVHINAYTRNELFFIGNSDWGDIYRRRVRAVVPRDASFDEVRQMQLLKIILVDQPEAIRKHRTELEKRLRTDVAALTESEPEYLEVLSPYANKGIGLKVLAESLGIDQSETAAIGDYLNDLEMVRWAGIGAAMANAEEEVKAAADIQVGSNDDAGVSEFIDYLIAKNASEEAA